MGGFLGVLITASISVLFSVSALAAGPTKCEDLIQDLKAMQSAQKELLQSLGQKNATIATVLDQHADKLEKTMTQQRTLRKSDLDVLHVSARAFRGHEKREMALIEKFISASDGLLQQVSACLANSETVRKISQK